jgi:nitroimidazol reductase NimA-like FMN-containing flavoprotein (pyridoxamine 5'-phosphate oxidase superfamily)
LNDQQDIQKAIETLFSGQLLAVLSTSSPDGHPYASLVCVVAEEDLSGIYFATSRATRKFSNLTAEPRAAMLVDNSQNRKSDIYEAMAVTAVGTAQEISGPEAEAARSSYCRRHPQLESFVSAPTTALIRMEVNVYYLVNRFQKVMEYHVA